MVKPCASQHASEIVARLSSTGFAVLAWQRRPLSAHDIDILYGDLREELSAGERQTRQWTSTANYLQSGTCLLLIVSHSCADLYSRLRAIRGDSHLGDYCAPGTIRHDFPGIQYFNSFHASIDQHEAYSSINGLGLLNSR